MRLRSDCDICSDLSLSSVLSRSLVGRQLGINAAGMGLVFCVVPIVGLFFKPLMGGLADKYEVTCRLLVRCGVSGTEPRDSS